MVSVRGMVGAAIAAAAAALAAAAAATPAAAQSSMQKSLERVAGYGDGCAASPPSVPFNASLIGRAPTLSFECYRPRTPLRFRVRADALVMTDEDGGGYNVKCAGEVIALRWAKAWQRPSFNVKKGIDIGKAFGDYNKLPDRFGDSCDAARAELGVKDVQYGPWGPGRSEFTRLLCLMTRIVRRLRDFRCDSINGPSRFSPAVLDSPWASLVTFLETVAFQYNIPV